MKNEEKPRGGFTVSELEGKVKKYGLEICLCAIFILTAIFTLAWGGAMLLWSILLSMILGVVGVLFPKPVKKMLHVSMHFVCKEKVTCIMAAIIGILLSIFLPVVIFALFGLIAGKSLLCHANACCGIRCDNDDDHHAS